MSRRLFHSISKFIGICLIACMPVLAYAGTTSGIDTTGGDLPFAIGGTQVMDMNGSGLTIDQGWTPSQAITINSNQIWKSNTTGDPTLYLNYNTSANVDSTVLIGNYPSPNTAPPNSQPGNRETSLNIPNGNICLNGVCATQIPPHSFGGEYSTGYGNIGPGGCNFPNVFTGDCTCPSWAPNAAIIGAALTEAYEYLYHSIAMYYCWG